MRPAQIADRKYHKRPKNNAPLPLIVQVRTPHGEQILVDLPHFAVPFRETANRLQGGNENPQHTHQHHNGLYKVGVRHGEVTAKERVQHNHPSGNDQGQFKVPSRHRCQPHAARNKLGQHVQKQAPQRDRCCNDTHPRRSVAVFQVLNRRERSQPLREFTHATPQDRQVHDAAAQVAQRVPHAEIPLCVPKRPRTKEHVPGH